MRTEMICQRICDALQAHCGDMMGAAREVGVSLLFVERWRKDDPEIDERMAEAQRVGTMGLVHAAIQRGVHGVDEDVYYKGEVCGTKRVYSDSLLMGLLKAKVPEFNNGETTPQVTVNIANIMPRAETYEEWLGMKQLTLEAPSDQPGDSPEYTDFTPVRKFQGIKL